MPLTKKSTTYKPFEYPEFVAIAEASEQAHWIEQEIDLTEDLRQWKDGTVTPQEKSLVIEIMKTFTQSDQEVSCGYLDHFVSTFKNNEVRMMLVSFAAREAIHMRAYALFTDTIGLPEESYGMFLKHKDLKTRMELMTDMHMESNEGIARALARTVISEGVALFGAFAMLLNFQRQGKMLGLCKINEWSLQDEADHVNGMLLLFKKFVQEHPEVITDSLKSEIYTMFREAVELEDIFIDCAFSKAPEGLQGLTPKDMKRYVRYIADRRLIQLGLRGNYNVRDNPLPWLDELITGDSLTNFFEQRVTDYAAAGLTGDWSWDEVIQIYTKPDCPYCVKAKEHLLMQDRLFEELPYTQRAKEFLELRYSTEIKTVPQIVIDDKLIGGYDELKGLDTGL